MSCFHLLICVVPLLAESFHFALSSAFLGFTSGLMSINPERIQICLVDGVAKGGKLVIECALPDEIIQLQDHSDSRDSHWYSSLVGGKLILWRSARAVR